MERQPIDWMCRELRRKVSIVGAAVKKDGRQVRVLLTDISYAGCQILSNERLCRGDRLVIRLPNMGDVSGQVRWVSGDNTESDS